MGSEGIGCVHKHCQWRMLTPGNNTSNTQTVRNATKSGYINLVLLMIPILGVKLYPYPRFKPPTLGLWDDMAPCVCDCVCV